MHGDGDRGNTTESAGILRGWKVMFRGFCGEGNNGSGTPAGMEQNCVGFPWEFLFNFCCVPPATKICF